MSDAIANKNILLAVSGGIAAYKTPELVRLIMKSQANVRVIATAAAMSFVSELTLQTLSGAPVQSEVLTPPSNGQIDHIDLARWADIVLIAPATAHCLAKLALGLADDMVSTVCLATQAPIIIAPAMNQAMWSHAATQANLACLIARGVESWGPDEGVQACGESGYGRMLPPEDIVANLKAYFDKPQAPGALTDRHVLITAGPTQEAIDPVRYLTNKSSGKMGFAMAQAAYQQGATVTLVSGPVALDTPTGVKRINVVTAKDMYQAVLDELPRVDLFIGTAAVADYYVPDISPQKLKKTPHTEHLSLQLSPTPDILSSVGHQASHRPFTVGFAAETENLVEHARTKLSMKQADVICANLIKPDKDCGFYSDNNELTVLSASEVKHFANTPKPALARQLITYLVEKYDEKYSS